MTPKEKAEEMVCSFEDFSSYPAHCALIAVAEILLTDPVIECGESDSGTEYKSNDSYWEKVKQEIEKL